MEGPATLLLLLFSMTGGMAPAGFSAPMAPPAPTAPSAPGTPPPPAAAPTIDPTDPASPQVRPDLQFVNDLIGLHLDEIATARLIIGESMDPDLIALAEQTIVQRQREIQMLQQWQKSH